MRNAWKFGEESQELVGTGHNCKILDTPPVKNSKNGKRGEGVYYSSPHPGFKEERFFWFFFTSEFCEKKYWLKCQKRKERDFDGSFFD